MTRKYRSKKKKVQPQVTSHPSDENTQVTKTESAPSTTATTIVTTPTVQETEPPCATTVTTAPTPSTQDPATAERTGAPQASIAVEAPLETGPDHSAFASVQPEPDAVKGTESRQLVPPDSSETRPDPSLTQLSEEAPTLFFGDSDPAARTLPVLRSEDPARTGESHVTFTNPIGSGAGGGMMPRSDVAYESDVLHGIRSPRESELVPAGGLCRGTHSVHEEHCASILARGAVWAAWLLAHAYAAVVTWRSWSSVGSVPLAGGFCAIVSIVVSVVVAAQLLAAATVLRGSRLWDGLLGPLKAAACSVGRRLRAVAFLKPLIWVISFGLLVALAMGKDSGALEGLTCTLGQFVLVTGCCLYSRHPTHINYGAALTSLLLLHLLALFFLYLEMGHEAIACLAYLVARTIGFSQEGAKIVLGYMASGSFVGSEFSVPLGFAFKIVPPLLFLGFLASLLFYCGLAPLAIVKFGWLSQSVLGLTSCEAIVAVANVFVGMGEAPLLIRPYVERLTLSEMHCVMTVGLATASATMLPMYTDLGLNSIDIIVASLLSAIAGVVSSKLLHPETELTALYCSLEEQERLEKRAAESLQDCMATVVTVVASVALALVSFLSAEAFIQELCGHITRLVSLPELTPLALLTPLLEPLVLLMGVSAAEAHAGARLLATGLLANEIVAYRQLTGPALSASLSVRTRRVLTYALCGFTNVGSLCITLGVLSALALSRSGDVVSLLLRALVAAAIANALTACAVGAMIKTKGKPVLTVFNSTEFLDG